MSPTRQRTYSIAGGRMSASTRSFIRHYVEMVIAMFAGMFVLGVPSEAALTAIGSGSHELHTEAPALALLWMAVIMTVPMVAWMRYRGHRWQPCAEMAASMFIPTFAAIGLLWAEVGISFGVLMTSEHVVMLASMLAAMLLRREEYSGHHHVAIAT